MINTNEPINLCKPVIIVVPANTPAGTMLPFPQDNELDQKVIAGIQTFPVEQQASDGRGTPCFTQAELARFEVVLSDDANERIISPVLNFNSLQNAGIRTRVEGLRINMRRSFIKVTQNSGGATKAVYLLMLYSKNQ